MSRARIAAIAVTMVLGRCEVARAGMPWVTLTEIARMRVQAISFFLVGFLVCAGVVRWIWNGLRADFPRLPRLSYGRATGLVALWGLLFLLVLTMISGARELMTPGAWKKEGYTFQLAEGSAPAVREERGPGEGPTRGRRQALERLRAALWTYARGHEGRFPPDATAPEIPEELWRVPDPSGMRYLYRGGLVADRGRAPLAFEPGIFGATRLVLTTDGAVTPMTLAELRRASGEGGP